MADNKIIYGNISSVKTSILERMKEYIDNIYDPGSFIPTEISEMMKEVTIDTNKEVAVFLDRKNPRQSVEAMHQGMENVKNVNIYTKNMKK